MPGRQGTAVAASAILLATVLVCIPGSSPLKAEPDRWLSPPEAPAEPATVEYAQAESDDDLLIGDDELLVDDDDDLLSGDDDLLSDDDDLLSGDDDLLSDDDDLQKGDDDLETDHDA